MTTASGLTFERRDARGAVAERDQVEVIYRRAYVPASGDDLFRNVAAFMNRFDSYTSNPTFDMVVAFEGGRPVGQAWGWPLPPKVRWWHGLTHEPEPGFTVEDGRRTFALSEVMVDHEHAGRGIAHRLHDQLLGGRGEERATLLVNPANVAAREAYLRWGWRPVSQLRPGWVGAPLFDVLVLPLPAQCEAPRPAGPRSTPYPGGESPAAR